MVINDMKKTIAVLALVAGLTSFAGSAKASVITANLNQFTDGSSFIGFGSRLSGFNYHSDSWLGLWVSIKLSGVSVSSSCRGIFSKG